MRETALLTRFATPRLIEALEDSPAVLIHGPRQCGKTTLALMACAPSVLKADGGLSLGSGRRSPGARGAGGGYEYVSFDDDVARIAAETDPMGFAAGLGERVILDEVQRAPTLFTALKAEIDRHRAPGRVLMIGSTHLLLSSRLSDSLAGRLQILRLHPLAQCEMERRDSGFLDALFGGGFAVRRGARLGPLLPELVAAGGSPAALARPAGRRRAGWYRDYIDALVLRDVRDLARIGALEALPRLLAYAAAQTARLFNANALAAPLALSRPTVRHYMTLLERVFLLERLPPWHGNRASRLVKTPKLHMTDTGLAAALLGADAAALAKDRALLGQLLETFAVQELRRQASWHDAPLDFHHFRDRDGAEVDVVVERGAGAVAGVEVKASATVTAADFRGLRKLARAAGDRFAGGAVLYDGETSAGFGDGLYAVPLRRLWEPL